MFRRLKSGELIPWCVAFVVGSWAVMILATMLFEANHPIIRWWWEEAAGWFFSIGGIVFVLLCVIHGIYDLRHAKEQKAAKRTEELEKAKVLNEMILNFGLAKKSAEREIIPLIAEMRLRRKTKGASNAEEAKVREALESQVHSLFGAEEANRLIGAALATLTAAA